MVYAEKKKIVIEDVTKENQNLVDKARDMLEKYESLINADDVSPEEFFERFNDNLHMARLFTPPIDKDTDFKKIFFELSRIAVSKVPYDRKKFGQFVKQFEKVLRFLSIETYVKKQVKDTIDVKVTDYISIVIHPVMGKTLVKVTFSTKNDIEIMHLATGIFKGTDYVRWNWSKAISEVSKKVDVDAELKEAIIFLQKEYNRRLEIVNVA